MTFSKSSSANAALIIGQQHSFLVSSMAMLAAYKYIGIVYFFIVLCNDGYAVVFILVSTIVYIASSPSLFLVFHFVNVRYHTELLLFGYLILGWLAATVLSAGDALFESMQVLRSLRISSLRAFCFFF